MCLPQGRAIKVVAYAYAAWICFGLIGFSVAGLAQNFYASSKALELTGVVALVLSVPILLALLFGFSQACEKVGKIKAFGITVFGILLVPTVLGFTTYFWLPRLLHTFAGTTSTPVYIVASKNDRATFRGCNTHYWVTVNDWPQRAREKICISEALWKQVQPNSRLAFVEHLSPFGATIYEIRHDG
jgi:hypothetical protein